jgi:hypothetical protein
MTVGGQRIRLSIDSYSNKWSWVVDATISIALAGLVIASGSAALSWYTWWSAGSRVRIFDDDGYVLDRTDHYRPVDPSALPIPDPVFVVDSQHGFMRIYRVVNTGRQALAVLDLWIDTGGAESEGLVIPETRAQISEQLPATLEPGHLLQVAVTHQFLVGDPAVRGSLQPRLCAQLGTGRNSCSRRRAAFFTEPE